MKKITVSMIALCMALVAGTALAKSSRVEVLHKPGTAADRVITISTSALPAHCRHGDEVVDDSDFSCDGGDGGDGGDGLTCIAVAVSVESLIANSEVATVTFFGFLCPTTVNGIEVSATDQLLELLNLPLSSTIVDEFEWVNGGLVNQCDDAIDASDSLLESGGISVKYSYFCQLVEF